MSIFNKISRALGFGKDDELEGNASAEFDVATPSEPAPAKPVESAPADASMIFDHAVRVFNEALPDFLARSVDPEAQKKILYESIDADLKRYIDSITESTQAKCREAWGVEYDKLKAEADEMRRKAQDLESKRSELNDKQLSANRQKRALSDRVHDLEGKVLQLEAEKEQLELENKSLVNKAKVASVHEAEIEELRQAFNAGGENAASEFAEKQAAKMAELNDQVLALQQQVKEQADAASAAKAEADAAKHELEKASASMQAAKVKDNMSDAMVADYQKKASQAIADAKAAQESAENLQKKADLYEAQMADLKKTVNEKEIEMADISAQLADARQKLENSLSEEEAHSIMKQVEAFANVRERLDNQISALSDKLRASQEENESLRNTIRNNLLEHARRQHDMQAQIDSLTQARIIDLSTDVDEPYKPDPASKKQKKKHPAKQKPNPSPTADVDSLLQGADWLVSTPPKGTSMRPPEDDSFGYQPPQRKKSYTAPDSQPSLFDLE